MLSCRRPPASDQNYIALKASLPDKALLAYQPQYANKHIEAFIQDLHKKHGFNGNVLVARKGKIVYENAIGWADYLHRKPLTIDARFQLASLTKPMTAVAILQLVERKKLRLNQDVRDFFPNFPYENITVEMLLTHRSGMMNYVYFIDNLYRMHHKNSHMGISNLEAMEIISKYKPKPYAKPNTIFHYNNSNYMILGAIIEKVSGRSYAQYMKEHIFKPARMNHTAVYSTVESKTVPMDVAVGHDRGQWRYSVVPNFLDGPVGDKGIYSTVGDLYLFDQALKAGLLLKQETQEAAYTPHNPTQFGHFTYGYGWRIFESPGEKIVYHTGWWHGFRHLYLRDLKNDITIILLTNLSNGSLVKLDGLFQILDMPVVRRSAYASNGTLQKTDKILF